MAKEATAFRAVLDVDDSIFSTIGRMPEKISDYCEQTGQSSPQSKNETIRTALEGLALNIVRFWKTFVLKPVNLETIHIVGEVPKMNSSIK